MENRTKFVENLIKNRPKILKISIYNSILIIALKPVMSLQNFARVPFFVNIEVSTPYFLYVLIFSNTGHSHRMCTNVFFSAPHFLHEGVLALLILHSMYSRLICPVTSPTNIPQCFLSSLLMN